MAGDVVALEENDPQDGEPLIKSVMQAGARINPVAALDEVRLRTLACYERLPKPLASLDLASVYPVEISTFLRTLADRLDQKRAQAA